MKRNTIIILAITISAIFIATLTVSFYLYSPKIDSNSISTASMSEVLGSTDDGAVVKSGPIGNTSSKIK